MQDFHQLKVWEKAHALTLDIYRITRDFPRAENFGLQSQMRRASVSIGANIAEGSGRSGRREFGQFLSLALSSASELEYHVLLVRDLGFIDTSAHHRISAEVLEVKRMLTGLRRLVQTPTQTDN